MEKDDLKIFWNATRLLKEIVIAKIWTFFRDHSSLEPSLEFSLYLSKYLPIFEEVTG